MKKQAVRLLQLCCYVVLGCVVIPLAMASPPGIPRDYTSYIDYDIQVRIDPATRMLEGKSLITFNKTRD